jgi:DNA (cytosine-5)-methyltransferase 3A
MLKLLIGGSPCTHWSIAQTKHRETEASGIGWELFLNYRIARDKYQPDYFLYENNKSMSPAIRAQITAELGVEPVLINSALVSAQNRQRLYWAGKRNPDGTYSQVPVEQPDDRGILLRDILETAAGEKGYALKPLSEKEMAYMVRETKDGRNHFDYEYFHDATKDKSACVTANTHKGVPYNVLAEPVRIGTIENDAKNQDHDSQQYRVYSPDAKSVTLCGNGGGLDAKTGLYAVPVAPPMRVREATKQGYVDIRPGECVDLSMLNSKTRRGRGMKDKSNCLTTSCEYYEYCGTLDAPIYQVRDGYVTIKGKEYPIKLKDGCYIIRKLTVTECKRLQTVPDTYAFPVSDTQAYKMLGNGWTVDVIAHVTSHFEGLRSEPVEVLSMYDGMSCGHIALDKLGAEIAAYYATEIDKYAILTTQHNFPDTVQLGDAFQVRELGWNIRKGEGET